MTNSIDRREKLSYEEFAKEYLYANKPVIVTDALREWKALRRWNPVFLNQEFGNIKFSLNDDLKGKAGYKGNGNSAVEYTMDGFIDSVLSF